MTSLNDILARPKSYAVYDFADGDQLDITGGKAARIYRVFDMFQNARSRSFVRIYNATTASGSDQIHLINATLYTSILSFGSNGRLFDNGISIEWDDDSSVFAAGDKAALIYELTQ